MRGRNYNQNNNKNRKRNQEEDDDDNEEDRGFHNNNNYNNNYDDSDEDDDNEYEEKGPENDDYDDENNNDEDKFKQSNIEDEINEAIRKRKEERNQQNLKGDKAFMENVDEHLGDDFEDTPWVPPSLEVAWEYHLAHLYRGGKIPISKVKLTKSTDIGLGVPMYFLFVQILGCTLFLMALLSFPSIIFSFFGHRIASENQDFFSFYRFTIGNIGLNPEDSDYLEKSQCTGAPSLLCLRIFTQEFSLQSVANILAVCEILQILIFLIGTYILKSACSRVRGGIGNRTCCVSDYAIRVDNIPSDTTIEQLLNHFSNLYALDKIDWKQRKPLEGATTVSNVYHNGQSIYKGTWIADIVIYGKIGKLIRSFKEKKKNMEELLRYRAMMKMYNHDTPHANGPNPKKYKKAEEHMLLAGSKIDEQTKKALSSAKKNAQTTTNNSSESQIKGLKSDAVVAFITFNYSESMARCVDDYRFYNTFPFSLLMPSQLKFRDCKIKVTHAPEPDEIVWENLEIPESKKFPRRIFSGIVAFFLMIIGFACILQSAKYKRIFDENVPQLSMCKSEIPAVYAGTYNVPSTVEIVRPDIDARKGEKSREDYDTECGKYIDKSFYAIYTVNGNFNNPLANYSIIDVCDYPGSKSSDRCPTPGANEFCPCIVTSSSDTCDTLSCLDGSSNCPKYKYTTIAGCYCYQELTNLLSGSFLAILNGDNDIDFQCQNFLTGYLLAISLLLVASLCTVVLNFLLRFFMTALSKREYHETNAEEQRAIVVKIFGTTYINMAFVVLFAYGYLGSKPSLLKQASVLDGDYTDFTSDWYANLGPYLTVTFILQAIGPIGNNLYKYLISSPCKRCYAFPQISNMNSNKYVMQADVNALELGKVFDVTSNTAQLQALLFFAMTYSPGIPLLMPLCAIIFFFYFNLDKLLLLRYYHKPPKMGDAVMRIVLQLLPWTCVIRSAIACWMLSSHQLFPDSKLLIEKIPSFTYFNSEHISHVYNHWIVNHADKHYFLINTGHRILRGHVFPIFVLFLLILLPMLIHKFWAYSPFYLIYRTISLLVSNVQKLKSHKLKSTVSPFELVASGDELRSEMAPFTGDYFQFLRSELLKKHILTIIVKLYTKLRNDLTAEELEAGWRVSYQGSNKVKMIQWAESVTIGGISRPKGSLKRTYEIISSHGCISYALIKIPQYVKVMAAIQEGVTSVLEDDEEMAKVSIVGTYKRHQDKRQSENDKKVKVKEELWTKKKPKKGNKVVPGSDQKEVDDVKMFSNEESSDEESV